jgi:hypothetical protein
MKQFNITAQVFDLCQDPSQALLYNEVIQGESEEKAKKRFEFNLLVDDIIVQKILSIEEIYA